MTILQKLTKAKVLSNKVKGVGEFTGHSHPMLRRLQQ